jgi:MSHA biogenesis protein MshK
MNRALLLLALGCTNAVAQSGQLTDPTRPPIVGGESPVATAPKPGPTLQSILISPSRRVAVINGSAVGIGGKVGDATVASISEGAVVLVHANHRREMLQLITAADKTERRTAAEVARGKGSSQ